MIELRGISRTFGTLTALSDVSLQIPRGAILGLLGENGAGKSTLMNILYGLLRPSAGSMFIDARPYNPRSPRDALQRGVGMVHQHFMLVPTLTVAENILLGMRGVRLRLNRASREIAAFADDVGLPVQVDARVGDLSVGRQQRVEILKALFRRVNVLILDEPTASLTPAETEQLFASMRRLRARGVAIVFISHKLKEVVGNCDAVIVLRRGHIIHAGDASGTTPEVLAAQMVGAPAFATLPAPGPAASTARPPATASPPMLEVRRLSAHSRGIADLLDIELHVHRGEIVGVAGVDGNGQDALIDALLGIRSPTRGQVLMDGVDLTRAAPRERLRRGIGHVPGDRRRQGLILDFSVVENTCLKTFVRRPMSHLGWLSRRTMRRHAAQLVAEADVRGPALDGPAALLSGGNQQKLVVARELHAHPRLLLVCNPTRGVDVAATAAIRARLRAARDAGAAVLLVSSDLDEIVELADRVMVMYRGTLRPSTGSAGDVAAIGRLMAGLDL
ncbi:MAG: Ribose import ATP-binding protein RbsA [Phycisphaerae bacterium]|nr:Ribose import ATP-binding protein RbsA [Phycisphaerae bacterium]